MESIVDGFRLGHDYLLREGATGDAVSSVLDDASELTVRAIFRPTMDYATVLSRSLSPVPLKSSESRQRQVRQDLTALGALRFDAIDDWVEAEHAQLMDGDIPRFDLRADVADQPTLMCSPQEDARARLQSLDDTDRELQVVAIREQLRHRRLVRAIEDSDGMDDRAEALAHQIHVLGGSLAGALQGCGRFGSWVFASYVPGLGSTMTHVDAEALYDGSAGTALVLAEAGRLMEDEQWSALAASVFEPLVDGTPPISRNRSGGMARGIGGLVFAMSRVGEATGRTNLLDAACDIAVTHGPRLVANDALDEVLYGRAGLLLGLLALEKRAESTRVAAVADEAAAHIIASAERTPEMAYWLKSGQPLIAHASHGNAGIAMALARWGRRRGRTDALDLSERAIAFDDHAWVEEKAGWRDGRFPEDAEAVTWSWCNGRSGALLCRLSVALDTGASFLQGTAAKALAAADGDAVLSSSPGLCCGTPGVLDALTEIGSRNPEVDQEQRLDQVVESLIRRTPKSHISPLTPGLFTGTGGLLFALLRAYAPDRLRSVLWFD